MVFVFTFCTNAAAANDQTVTGFANLIPVRTLEKAKASGNFAVESNEGKDMTYPHETESDTSDTDAAVQTRRPKKLKVTGHH